MNQKREKEFNELFKARDEINSEIHKNKNINDFQKYGLINTQWYKDYIPFIMNSKLESNYKYKERLFKYKYLHPKNDERDYSYLDGIGAFNFPSDFIFVTENFMSLISDNFPNHEKNKVKSYLSTILIGGECIILRDFIKEVTRSIYIIIYEENKGNINNNIDFILKYKDYYDLQNACKLILENNVWIFLKTIGFSEDENEKEIKNGNGKIIGYIIRNGEIKRKDEIKLMIKMKGEGNKISKNIIPKFDSILNCLYLSNIFIQELSKFSSDNKNIITKALIEYAYKRNELDKIKSIFSKSIKIDDFKYIFYEIFEKLDSELSNENENKEFSGEEDKLKEFKEEYEKGSIIKRLFYCPQEYNKFCTSCNKTFHIYQYSKIILLKSINPEKVNLLNEKIFKAEEIKEKCPYCHEESGYFNSKKYISFPMILIIVIEEDQIGNLNMEKEIKNDEGISYELYSIIEANTNMLYFKNNQNGLWFKYNGNKREEIESKIPIVLFYKLLANNHINNNNQNRIINNMNNLNFINNKDNNINIMNNLNNMKNMNNMNNMSNMMNNIYNMNNNMNNMNNMMNNLNNMNNMNNMMNNMNSLNNVKYMNNMSNTNNMKNSLDRYHMNSNNNNEKYMNNINNDNMNNMNENYMNMNNSENINSNKMINNNVNSGYNQINNLENELMISKRQIVELKKENEILRYELEKEKIFNKHLEEKLNYFQNLSNNIYNNEFKKIEILIAHYASKLYKKLYLSTFRLKRHFIK